MEEAVRIKREKVKISSKNPSLQRIDKRCTDCGLCFRICENVVGLDRSREKKLDPVCLHCGQCIMNCPTGALCTKFDYKKVLNILNAKSSLVSISIAPAVRVALLEEFGKEAGTNGENVLPTILRKLGFDLVFDVCFGADVTVIEEASELLSRLKKREKLPMFTSCCPSWVKYAEMFHPELVDNLSTAKSPISMQSTLIKTYYKELNNIEKDIISVVVAPCTAKKYEAIGTDTDYIITTQELAMMIRESGIDMNALKESEFDKMLSTSSKSGLMFGRSGGVMEAALSTAYCLLTKKNPPKGYFHLTGKDGLETATYKMGGISIDVAVVYGMKNLEKLLPDLDNYDFIEVMNCPNGCIGGGGNPLIPIKNLGDTRINRTNSLNNDNKRVLYAHQNPEIDDLYKYYLTKPLSKKSEQLLHTEHKDLSRLIKKKQLSKDE